MSENNTQPQAEETSAELAAEEMENVAGGGTCTGDTSLAHDIGVALRAAWDAIT